MNVIKQGSSAVGEWTANVVGVDPHKRTLTATVLDARGASFWAVARLSRHARRRP